MKNDDRRYREALLALDSRVEAMATLGDRTSKYMDADRERIRLEYADHCSNFKDWELLAQRLPAGHLMLERVCGALTQLAQTEQQRQRLKAFLDGRFAQGKLSR
ncbi:hypothetical protein EXS71_04755 [Candidatus Uhrbacteria bacterium]|nr:hypothetical protein [Candidatus Uhrbacteria bacterium]